MAFCGADGKGWRAVLPFDPIADYDQCVDGKPRYDGVRSFLAACGIDLPEGEMSDPAAAETVAGLGNRKNEIVSSKMLSGGCAGPGGLGPDWPASPPSGA
jgi:hypothetical protein